MSSDAVKSSGPKCPICKAAVADLYKPFCSKRCADIDLGKWFTNSYAIPGADHDDEADQPVKGVTVPEDEAL